MIYASGNCSILDVIGQWIWWCYYYGGTRSCLKLSVTGVNLSLPLEHVVNVNGESKIGKSLKAPSNFHIAVLTQPNTLGHSDNIVDYEKLWHRQAI